MNEIREKEGDNNNKETGAHDTSVNFSLTKVLHEGENFFDERNKIKIEHRTITERHYKNSDSLNADDLFVLQIWLVTGDEETLWYINAIEEGQRDMSKILQERLYTKEEAIYRFFEKRKEFVKEIWVIFKSSETEAKDIVTKKRGIVDKDITTHHFRKHSLYIYDAKKFSDFITNIHQDKQFRKEFGQYIVDTMNRSLLHEDTENIIQTTLLDIYPQASALQKHLQEIWVNTKKFKEIMRRTKKWLLRERIEMTRKWFSIQTTKIKKQISRETIKQTNKNIDQRDYSLLRPNIETEIKYLEDIKKDSRKKELFNYGKNNATKRLTNQCTTLEQFKQWYEQEIKSIDEDRETNKRVRRIQYMKRVYGSTKKALEVYRKRIRESEQQINKCKKYIKKIKTL